MPELTFPGPDLAGTAPPEAAETGKVSSAQLRAAPLARLLDYGLALADAVALRDLARRGWPWHVAGLGLARRHLAAHDAVAASAVPAAASRHLLAAAVSANVAQLMMAGDSQERRRIYRLSLESRDRWLATQGDQAGHFTVPGVSGELSVVYLRPPGVERSPVVAVWGGTSGWGIVYRRCAQALLDAGLAVALVELPGQGNPRLLSGSVLGPGFYETAGRLVSALRDAWFSTGSVGVWGQSMGGLLAAQAASHVQVAACCVTSSPARPSAVVAQHSRQRQLWLDMLELRQDAADGHGVVAGFDFGAGQRIGCPVLVVHGGQDPLVTEADRDVFTRAGAAPSTSVTWADGEHCVYGRAQERDDIVASWFRHVLGGPP